MGHMGHIVVQVISMHRHMNNALMILLPEIIKCRNDWIVNLNVFRPRVGSIIIDWEGILQFTFLDPLLVCL